MPSMHCPEAGCTFTCTTDNALRGHKAKVHAQSVKVIYYGTTEVVIIPRIGSFFHCEKCLVYRSEYPSVIQKHAKICQVEQVPAIEATSIDRRRTPSPPVPEMSTGGVEIVPPAVHHSPSSPSCSPQELPFIHEKDYQPIPDERTIVHHPPFNLPSIGIVVNVFLRCIICLNCERAIDASNVIEHFRREHSLLHVPGDLPSTLETTYKLVPYKSIVSSPGMIPPVFGIPLKKSAVYFCDCGKGYAIFDTLRTHQTRRKSHVDKECPLRESSPGYHKAYAQRLSGSCSYFEVDPNQWRVASGDLAHYPLAFCRSLPPLRDYSHMEIKGAEDEMNTSCFFFSQRWLAHLEGYSPEDIGEVTKELTPEAPYGERLRQVGVEFLMRANTEIGNHNTFGILKLMGHTTEQDTSHQFSNVQENTIKKYALTLHRLVYGVLRQLDPSYSHKYRYPLLHASQLVPLEALRRAFNNETSMDDLVGMYQAACFSLFAHHQHKFDTSRHLNQFFSPVICFLVVNSVREKGGFQVPGVITQYIAHIMFSMRAVMLFEVIKKARDDEIGLSDAYSSFKEYLTGGHETPMAYYYNASNLLGTIRSDETTEARFSCTDDRGREFSYEGSIIKIDDITKMIKDLYDRYNAQMRSKCFFSELVPESISLKVDVDKIVDNLQNTQAGYSFIDDSRNPFESYRSAYGEWLLSDSERAAKFAYIYEGRLIWKPQPCVELLRQMQDIREILLLLCIFTAGPSSRASEVARQLLRNVPGSLRNLFVLFHEVCLVDIQDKTSHKHLKDKYVPHCPTRKVAALLVYNLAIFRPFEELLAEVILGKECGLRYHQQLWPGIKETFSDTNVSDAIGRECGCYLAVPSAINKVSYKILFWRNLVSAILKHQSDLRTITTHEQCYVDTAMMHSTRMANARYGRETSHLPTSDPRQVVECIKVGYVWHGLLNIEDKGLRRVDLDEQLHKIESTQTGSDLSTGAHLSTAAITSLTDKITDIVGGRLEDMVRETVMNAIAEMTHIYFPKVLPNLTDDMLDISAIIIPPRRLLQLREFTRNPLAQFNCPEQAALLELMLLGKQSVLAVLGTGIGKTFTILFQAWLQKELVTIVVLPLSSLHDDLRRRAGELRVSYGQWVPSGKFNMNANVISVSIEHLGFPEFVKFISDLENHRRLGLIVFDEIHKMITDSDYRAAFRNFHSLHSVKAVVFGLTGSLPPALYSTLCELTSMTWKVIRTGSSRKELKYQVITVKSERVDATIVAHLQKAISSYGPQDRAIVFCRSKHYATRLAGLLKVHAYYAVQDDDELERNRETMRLWLSGETKIMVSTSILGCGMDYAHIRDVVHRDPSFTMLDQYQEDSRGGRDGLECRATTFLVENSNLQVPNTKYDLGTRMLFESMSDTVNCRRMAPTLYLDGRAVQCITLPGSIFCENCEKSAGFNATTNPRISTALPNRPSVAPISVHSPPRRSIDLFDTSNFVDLRDWMQPPKRKSQSSDPDLSQDMNSSSSKKQKLSHTNVVSTSMVIQSPVSPTLARPSHPLLLPRTSNALSSIPGNRRPAHSAGIVARQHQLAAQDNVTKFRQNVIEPIMRAFSILQDRCVMCWISKKHDWEEHSSDNCHRGFGTNTGDSDYSTFRTAAFKLPRGWCFSCLIHQKLMDHPRGHPNECLWRGIIQRVIYIYSKRDINCPFVPADLDVMVTEELQVWLSKDPGDYANLPFHNGLKLFLWMVKEFKLDVDHNK